MTATESNRVTSDNSVSHDRDTPLTRRPEYRRLLEYVANRGVTTTRAKLAVEAGWTIEETADRLDRLEEENYIQLVETTSSFVVLLTERGEAAARGGR